MQEILESRQVCTSEAAENLRAAIAAASMGLGINEAVELRSGIFTHEAILRESRSDDSIEPIERCYRRMHATLFKLPDQPAHHAVEIKVVTSADHHDREVEIIENLSGGFDEFRIDKRGIFDVTGTIKRSGPMSERRMVAARRLVKYSFGL